MSTLQAIILALIQGVTEFLPISSSAHLILPKELLGWPDQGLAFDVAVHIGSLVAVIAYFRQDVSTMFVAWINTFRGHTDSTEGKLAWCIFVATIPAVMAGLLLGDFIEAQLRSMEVIAATTIVFGLLLWWADAKVSDKKALSEITFGLALVIGLAQALALIPGTSRSGITITIALFLGFSRIDAARFSFLLAIPVILLSGGYMTLQLLSTEVDWATLFIGILVSAISAYLCIHYFLGFINRIGMLPFVIYRLLLGFALIAIIVL